ncbi:hypothetical protein D7004_15365 [Pedobacter jejuensis]|uniref:Uncharacterized protein n=2 Tax=Pedobacter jejuensis TaxID=1268550 RepID=A0A3N0BQP7_9SPHI|nr:hypothetical protein D7004_15365 [Pedobacter jejuensis]
MACTNEKNMIINKTEVMHGSFTVEEDDVGPPPPNFVSRFKTVNEWLTFTAENDKPKKAIFEYQFDVFEGENDYTLCLTGINTYDVSKTYQRAKIEFMPSEMYFPIPLNDYKGLTKAQVFDYLTTQLDGFLKSSKFKNSYFSKAKSIKTGWKGEIWSNK